MRKGFTLVELMVVIAIIALLIGIVLPSLGQARHASRRAACLANFRSLETAHWAFMVDHRGRTIGTAHGQSWIDVLRDDYNPALLLRSPLDTSPHFAGGLGIAGKFRQSSYSINLYLSPDGVVHGLPGAAGRIDDVPAPAATVHFVLSAFDGPNAVSDHAHPNLWFSSLTDLIPIKASAEVQINAHAGKPGTWEAVTAYGFLDGHAQALPFQSVYQSPTVNKFDPARAK